MEEVGDQKWLKEKLNQWFFKISNFSDQANDLNKLDQWPEKVKQCKNWIGKSFDVK